MVSKNIFKNNVREEINIQNKINRLGEENYNYQGCLMKIVEYFMASNIFVEFQDNYKAKVHADYKAFKNGGIKNPYYPEVYGHGMVGQKYKAYENGKDVKEYKIWHSMLQRCYDDTTKEKYHYYNNVLCCDDWLLYENFYEWLHKQENFEKWFNGKRWAIDKDILIKGNKIYSPEFCSLVPPNVNSLFTKRQSERGQYPIGVYYNKKEFTYKAQCNNPFEGNKRIGLGSYKTPIEAFNAYKKYKEHIIKQVAITEYAQGNITERCYEAMMTYEVEITD